MNKPRALSMFWTLAVSLPGVSVANDRLDAPGPGYREQVERFAPRRGEAKLFQLQVAPAFGPAVSSAAVTPLKAREVMQITNPSTEPALLDSSDFSQPIRLFDLSRSSGVSLSSHILPVTPKTSP